MDRRARIAIAAITRYTTVALIVAVLAIFAVILLPFLLLLGFARMTAMKRKLPATPMLDLSPSAARAVLIVVLSVVVMAVIASVLLFFGVGVGGDR